MLIPTHKSSNFAADTQNVKTGRYNKGTLYSKMFVVGVLYFGLYRKMSCEILKLLNNAKKDEYGSREKTL